MLRLLGTRRWLTWLCVAALWSVLCMTAGIWQWHRWQSKSATQSLMDHNYDADPVPITSALLDGRSPAKSDQWMQVTGTGHYVGSTLLVRNRPGPSGDFGYEALDIFEVQGVQVLVDRGWVANGANAATPASVPSAPSGEVTMTGWVRLSERDLNRPPIPGQLSSISVKEAERSTHRNLVDGYVTMRSEKLPDGRSPARPAAQNKPSQGMAAGINLSYALQWWLGIIASFTFVLVRARREHLDQMAEAARAGEQPGDGAVMGASEASSDAASREEAVSASSSATEPSPQLAREPARSSAREKKPRERKKRIWDEEDE